MHDEGVIKFECRWEKTPVCSIEGVEELMQCRDELFSRKLIGVYEDGIGYGNISLREGESGRFLISGTQTGHFEKLSKDRYVLVTAYDIEHNRVECKGPVQASSESLTHAMIYGMNPAIRAVAHAHHNGLWKRFKNRIPTTREEVAYGTPAMAVEVQRLYAETDLKTKKIFVMAGHQEGLVSFGASPREACNILLNLYET
ncbi:MAG: class II aldolase/adducin family protein [Candidatus Omnitrophica bacterium]|nr:class II aldolase/adducin family protein [Candidatus Omnitrophota bacterium]